MDIKVFANDVLLVAMETFLGDVTEELTVLCIGVLLNIVTDILVKI